MWVNQPTSDAGKRFCSLNICFRPEGEQPKVSIIFWGKGNRHSKIEKESWDLNVDVYFQTKAWANTEFCVEWAQKTLKHATNDEDRFVLYVDDFGCQKPDRFKDAVSANGGLVLYCLANATDIWQPIDAGYGRLLKALVMQYFFDWLEHDEDLKRWYGVSSFTASEKRILITKWVGSGP